MAKDNNLKDFLTDVADSIRRKKGTTDKINPQDFSNEIENIETGIEGVSVEDVIGIGKTLILDENIEPTYIKVGSSDKNINIHGVGNNLDINGEDTQVLVLNGSITGENFNPENIKKDVEIFGLTGTYDNGIEGVTEENGTIGIKENSNSTKIYLGSANNIKDIEIVKNQVNVRLYSNGPKVVCYGSNTQIEMMGTQKAVATNLSPQNIKKDVNVLGHIGTFEGGVEGVTEKFGAITIDGNTTSTLVNIIDQKEVELTGAPKRVTSYIEGNTFKSYYSANVELAGGKITAENLAPENIKKGVNILGHVGTLEVIEGVTEKNGAIRIDGNTTSSTVRIDDTKHIEFYGENSDIGMFGNASMDVYQGNLNIGNIHGGGSVTATNLEPQNIAKDVNILGVIGTFETGTDTSDATATANDILLGKTAYGVDGLIEGTIETYDGASDVGSSGESATIKTKGSWQGTSVEDGNVENVYLNTNLSVEEVVDIIESANLTYDEDDAYIILYKDSSDSSLVIIKQGNKYGIGDIRTMTYYFHNIDDEEIVSVLGFAKGWNPNITMPIAINGEVVSGGENAKLTSLISTTPFTYQEGTPIELSGEYEQTTITITEKGTQDLINLIVNDKKIPFKIVGDFKDTIDFITDRMHFLTELVNDKIDIIQTYGCAGCESLINVDLPNLNNAQSYAFAGCYNLITVNLPNLSYADSFAFTHCGFEEINLPKLESVHTGAFQGCDDLKKIYLASVNYIGGHSFYMCSNLTDIYIGYDGVPTLSHSQWFDLAGTIQGYINVHVRPEYASQYATAPNWSSLITDGKIKIVGDYSD